MSCGSLFFEEVFCLFMVFMVFPCYLSDVCRVLSESPVSFRVLLTCIFSFFAAVVSPARDVPILLMLSKKHLCFMDFSPVSLFSTY